MIVIGYDGAQTEDVERALELSAFDAQQRLRRGGWQLHRIADESTADVEADRLRESGLDLLIIPEDEVNAALEPIVAVGGRASSDGVVLRTPASRRLVGSELLLIVTGPIQREQAPDPDRKRPQLGPFEPGFRVQFHVRDEIVPIELDPASFVFDSAAEVTASLLEVRGWIPRLSPPAPVDDDFKHASPALAPTAEPEPILNSLGRRRERDAQPVMLDNLRQFRLYSGLRAAIKRRL